MNLTKKKTALLAFALIALAATVSATSYFIISNYIHKEATVKRVNGIEIEIYDFPTEITIGKNYVFTTNTKNVLDQDLVDLMTYIVVWMPTDNSNVTLEAEWLYVFYKDAVWEGKLTFSEQEDGSLLCAIGPWTAPVGYNMDATVTFRLEAQSLPASLPEGKVCMDIWVESPSFP